MSSPEGRILKADALDGYILGVGHIDKTWALFVLVGALGIPLAAKPERLMILQSIAIDGSFAGHGESIEAFHIDQCFEISARFTLHAGLGELIIADIV